METSTTISPVLDSTRSSKHSSIAKTTHTTELKSSSKEPGECSTIELTRVERGVITLRQ